MAFELAAAKPVLMDCRGHAGLQSNLFTGRNSPVFDLTVFPLGSGACNNAQGLSAAPRSAVPSVSRRERYLIVSERVFACCFGIVLLVPKQGHCWCSTNGGARKLGEIM